MTEQSLRDAKWPFRPLIASTSGSGLMAIGVLQFTGAIWASAEPESQEFIAVAARMSLLIFLMNAAALALAFTFRSGARPILQAMLDGYGALVFLVGAFLTGGYISDALFRLRPETSDVPESLKLFLAIAGLTLVGLVAAALVGVLMKLAARLLRLRPRNLDADNFRAEG